MQNLKSIMTDSPLVHRFSVKTQEEATKICPNCGPVPGREILLQGSVRYVRGICACQRAAQDQKLHEQRKREWMQWQEMRTFSWLGERWDDSALLEKTFDNFDYGVQREAYETTQLFTQIMSGTLILHGTYGTGKTHLLAALCNDLRQLEKSSLFTTAPKLFSAIQSKIAIHEDYSNIITSMMKTNLLVIDDIDKSKHSDFREEIYFEIIDERVKAGRPIAISTNRLDELENYVGGAVCSRLKVGQIDAQMLGLDYREGMQAV